MRTNGPGTPSWAKSLLLCEKDKNSHNYHTVATLEEYTCCTVGHLPREICSFLRKMGGAIIAEITEL